jgi:D-mannonate dehydratase
MKQARTIDHTSIKQDITKEFQNRLNTILKTELNGRNTIKAINTFAIPILCYTFGIIKWTVTDLDRLQRKLELT